jgi:hypothetical protein
VCLSIPFLPFFISHLHSAPTLVPSVVVRQHQCLNLAIPLYLLFQRFLL